MWIKQKSITIINIAVFNTSLRVPHMGYIAVYLYNKRNIFEINCHVVTEMENTQTTYVTNLLLPGIAALQFSNI